MKGSILAAVMVGALVCGTSLAAQSAPGDAAPAAQAAPSDNLRAGTKILSDTMGVDFGSYLQQLRSDVQRNWAHIVPAKSQPPELKKGTVGVHLTILPDGRIGSIKLESSSGDVDYDKAAWYAITSEGKFAALPADFHGPQLELRIGFFYNVPIPTAK